MALSGSDGASDIGRPTLASLHRRVRAWLTDQSDRSAAQRGAGTAFVIRVASAVLAYASQVLLARWMGSFEFGIYVYVWTWVLLIGGLVDLGLCGATQRFIPEYTERKSFDLLRGFLSGSRWLAFAGATLAAIVLAGAVRIAEPWLDQYVVIPLYLGCATLPLYGVMSTQDGIARSYNWVHLGLLPPYIIRQVLLIVMMGGAYWIGLRTDAVMAMVLGAVSIWAVTLVQLVLLNRRLQRKVEPGRKAYAPRIWFATSLPIILVEGFYLLLTYADVLVLQLFRPPDEVGIYYAAAKTLALVAFIYFSVSATTAHKFTQYHAAGDRARLSAFLNDAIAWTFWPSLGATLLILAFGKPMLNLFGEGFAAGYPLMFILAFGLLARAAVGPVERLLNMLGEQRACATVYASALAVNIALCFVLIPRWGPIGAAISTTTAMLFEAVLLFVVTKRRLGFHTFIWKRAEAE